MEQSEFICENVVFSRGENQGWTLDLTGVCDRISKYTHMTVNWCIYYLFDVVIAALMLPQIQE
jgi:hypothetical protein